MLGRLRLMRSHRLVGVATMVCIRVRDRKPVDVGQFVNRNTMRCMPRPSSATHRAGFQTTACSPIFVGHAVARDVNRRVRLILPLHQATSDGQREGGQTSAANIGCSGSASHGRAPATSFEFIAKSPQKKGIMELCPITALFTVSSEA